LVVVEVGFEDILAAEEEKPGFGSQRYVAAGKERPHISKSKLAARDDAEYLKLGESKFLRYDGWMSKRYLAFEGLSYDFMVSLYDVNSPKAYAVRLFDPKGLMGSLRAGLKSMRTAMPNIEARVIGLQNKGDHAFLKELLSLLANEGVRLIEVDLFGEDIQAHSDGPQDRDELQHPAGGPPLQAWRACQQHDRRRLHKVDGPGEEIGPDGRWYLYVSSNIEAVLRLGLLRYDSGDTCPRGTGSLGRGH
jgi:hypothetical protein